MELVHVRAVRAVTLNDSCDPIVSLTPHDYTRALTTDDSPTGLKERSHLRVMVVGLNVGLSAPAQAFGP